MPTYLVTGASGYVGSRLVGRLVAKGHDVVVLYRDESRIAPLLTSPSVVPLPVGASVAGYRKAIELYNVEGIFHLASKAVYASGEFEIAALIEANVTLGVMLLEAMSTTSCRRFVNAGTYWQHYDGPEYNPICLYAATKQAFMDIVDYYAHWKGFRCITLKLTDIYGDQDPRPKVFTLLDKAARTGERLKMTEGRQLLSFLHVEDAIGALCEAARQTMAMTPSHAVYTVGTPLISLRDAVAMYLEITGKSVVIEWGALPYRPTQIMTPWLGQPLPNWMPAVDLKTGLRNL
ncbi:MAG: NAD-dependent epimerase/dehydratase family protein [Solidesulfovibrio sp.]